MDGVNLLGYLAGLLLTISLIPQVLQSWRTKSTKDISLWRYVIYTSGIALLVIYAFLVNDIPVAVTNIVALPLALSVIYLKLKHG
ncbi:MAG: SemiSWEET transporter [Candidatus Micrarchaeia archaeon]|jgi:MtN3 and saliva related transmembrane protein